MKNATQATQTVRPAHITPAHWRMLTEERKIKPEWVIPNVESMTASEASEYLGYPAKSDGLMLKGDGYQWQFKPDRPWESEDGKCPKYRSCKDYDGYDAMVPCHPSFPGYWDNEDDFLYLDSWEMDGKSCIVVTEGFFKAVTLTQNGIPAIALLGVEMGLTSAKDDPQGKRYLVPTLEKLAKQGFGFIIAFDADCATNSNVLKAQFKLSEALQRLNVPVYSVTGLWDVSDGKGADDYINAHSESQFRHQIMRKAETIEEWKARAEKQFQADKRDKKLSEADIADKLSAEYRELYRYHESFMSWRFWNGKFWEKQTDHRMFTQIRQTARAKGYKFNRSATIKDIVTQMSWILNYGNWETADRERYINCQNGTLDLETGKIEPHRTGFGFTSVLPYEVHPIPKSEDILGTLREHCPDTFNFLITAAGYDDKQALFLLAIISGVLRWQFSKHQKFVHLRGVPGSGKGTFLRLLQDIVGDENSASSDLRAISATNSEYEFSRVIDKQLLVFPDERSTVGMDAVLKMSGGDSIRFREPYGKPGNAPFLGTMIIASNTGVFKGDTTGLARRLVLVEFPAPVPSDERDPDLNAKLRAEIPSLIPIALMIDSEGFAGQVRGMSAENNPRQKIREWGDEIERNAIAEWMEGYIDFTPGAGEVAKDLYESFKTYCEESGRQKTSLTRFGTELTRLITWLDFPVEKTKKGGCWWRHGLRLKTELERETMPTVTDILAIKSGIVSGDSLDSSGTVSGTVETPSQSGLGIVGTVSPNTEQKTASGVKPPPQSGGSGCDSEGKNKSCQETIPTVPNPATEGDTSVSVTVPKTVQATVQNPILDKRGTELEVGNRVKYDHPFDGSVPNGTKGNVTEVYKTIGGEWRVVVQWDKQLNGKKLEPCAVDPSEELVKGDGWD